MSLLYEEANQAKYYLNLGKHNDKIVLSFSANIGKHGTIESVDEYEFTVKELLDILQKHDAGGF